MIGVFPPQVADISYLDEEIVSLHSEIVELQRSPFARRQGDVMEQLSVFILCLIKNCFLREAVSCSMSTSIVSDRTEPSNSTSN